MRLEAALSLVREGRIDDAEAARPAFVGPALARLELAIAQARGDRSRVLELAEHLWHICEVDPTVLAVLVHNAHPELRDAAATLLMRSASDAAYDVSAAWTKLAERPGDLDAWRDVLSSMISGGRDLEAVDGVARALGERHAGFELWALLTTILIAYRRRTGLYAAVELAHGAFPHAPEACATSAMIFLGLGDLERAAAELAEVGNRAADHPLVTAARSAMAEAVAASSGLR
jgi:hypothetical protein